MNYITLIIVGIAGVILGAHLGRRRVVKKGQLFGQASLDNVQDKEREEAKKKRENLEKARQIFAERDRVANDDIEALLGVSDATATRYLDELEEEGRIRQIGKTGRHVYYEKI